MKFNKRSLRNLMAVATASAACFVAGPANAQDVTGGSRPSTVLPTDVVPLPLPSERQALGESMKLRLWQKLPARFYFSATTESSFRLETNVFQTATLASTINKFAPEGLGALLPEEREALQPLFNNVSAEATIFRVSPNVTAGWSLTPNTRVFANYFCLRDQLFDHFVLNTTINQYGMGIEHSRPLGQKFNYELQFTARELWQTNSQALFDYLPSATISYFPKPGWVAYLNSLLQMRCTEFVGLPNRNITPFYTLGVAHQRGKFSFSANGTLLNSFQKGFSQSSIDLNTSTIILDFEIARQIVDRISGLQAFARAEPVYNIGGKDNPGLSGMDFRMFFGLRMSAYKPSLLGTISMLKQHYQPEPKKPKKEKLKPLEAPPPPTEGNPENQQDGGGDKKKKQQPGAPIGWQENDSDDLSVITLNPEESTDRSIFDDYSKLLNANSLVKYASQHESSDNSSSSQIDEENSNLTAATEAAPKLDNDELTPTAAPMHGFLGEGKKLESADSERISTIGSDSSID